MKNLQDFFTDNHMEEVLHSLNTIPWTFDFRTNVITSNLSFVDPIYVQKDVIHEWSLEEFIDCILPEYREETLENYNRLKNGMLTRTNWELRLKMGKQRIPIWIELFVVAKGKDPYGRTAQAVGCATIIQERKEAEMVMLTAQRKAEQANLIKTNFLANMTHEFRTPLNAILGFSTIMAHTETIEERMQCLGAIQTSGSLLLQIIEDVIELSKLEANEIELKRNLIDINVLLEKAVEEAQPMRKPDVTMSYHHTEVPIILHGDEKKISLVMKQLLDNACKYTEHGTIDVYCHKSSENAVVTVKDTGVGMTPENVHKIFNRFYKGNSFIPGTGLGMCLVKGLVELWNGTITVDSVLDEGTSITFTIPLHTFFFQNRPQRIMEKYF